MVYPAIAFILITIPTFTSSQSIWLVSANTSTKQIRFGPRDFCGFNRTHGAGTDVYRALGCVYGGTSYTVAKEDLDIVLPSSISYSLSKCAALLYLGECQGEEVGWAGPFDEVERRVDDRILVGFRDDGERTGFALLILALVNQGYTTVCGEVFHLVPRQHRPTPAPGS
jgi:hypothetical protein